MTTKWMAAVVLAGTALGAVAGAVGRIVFDLLERRTP